MKRSLTIGLALSIVLVLALFFTAGEAKEFPTRRIDIVVPFGPGSGTDTTMRAFAPELQKVLGVPVVAMNVEGSGGLAGMEFAAKQPADGYTLFCHTPTHILAEIQNLSPISLTKHFVPVARLIQNSVLVVTSAKGRFKTWDEMVEFAKAHPGEVTVGGYSPKGIDAIAMKMIERAAGIELTFVPFGGGGEAKAALLGGHIDLTNDDPENCIELAKAGEIIPLLVAAEKRLPAFPDTPTTLEKGINIVVGPWRGLAVRKDTSPEIITKLEEAIKKAYESEGFQNWLKTTGLDQIPGWMGSAELQKKWEDDIAFFAKAFKELGL
ncbi:MAG: tripartite tricarboxylate transporter substrate binding protein [Synergistota bacterium]|nr:tripartite tricarboxylate transporter substrate binding protein [Synergistota bacterium]